MLLDTFNGDFDYWGLFHKVTFDGVNKLIIVNPGETTINVQIDIYSDWKEWVRLDSGIDNVLRVDNSPFLAALRTIGGDPTVVGEAAGDLYFLINGWQIQVNERVKFIGALFSDDFSTPFVLGPGGSVESTVSSLVTRIFPQLTQGDLDNIGAVSASAVWNSLLEDFLIQNSFGEYVQTKLLKKTTFIALK